MHGSSGGTVVINISPKSEKDEENERLRDIARHSEKITSPGGHKCPSDEDIVRDLDLVLYENMDDESESSLFAPSEMPRFARAMGANDAEISQIQGQMALKGAENGLEPAGLSTFKQDYGDYRKFGGDVVAMELDREMMDPEPEMSLETMDGMLSTAMDSSSMADVDDSMNRATSALQEQLGDDAIFVLEGEQGGLFSFSVDTNRFGRVRYVYDSNTGEGRVMRGE